MSRHLGGCPSPWTTTTKVPPCLQLPLSTFGYNSARNTLLFENTMLLKIRIVEGDSILGVGGSQADSGSELRCLRAPSQHRSAVEKGRRKQGHQRPVLHPGHSLLRVHTATAVLGEGWVLGRGTASAAFTIHYSEGNFLPELAGRRTGAALAVYTRATPASVHVLFMF